LVELEKVMFGQERRVGWPPRKKRKEFGGGLCPFCCRKRVDSVCGCGRNASEVVVWSEEENIMSHAMYAAGDEAEMCVDDAGIPVSDDEFTVPRDSDADEEDDDNEDGLDEEMEGDFDVEVMEGDVETREVYNGVNVVELPQQCRNCYQKKNQMVEDMEPYCLDFGLYNCTAIQTRLKFCSFRRCDVRNEAKIVLCAECACFLVNGEKQEMKNVWPALMWDVLRNGVIAGHYGIGVWSNIPMKC
jgi:hypothetical protein